MISLLSKNTLKRRFCFVIGNLILDIGFSSRMIGKSTYSKRATLELVAKSTTWMSLWIKCTFT